MAKTKDELKVLFATDAEPTGADFALLIDGVEGPKGAQGNTGLTGKDGIQGPEGAKGATGTAGTPGIVGKDGFGTEAQYNDVISRIEALEAK